MRKLYVSLMLPLMVALGTLVAVSANTSNPLINVDSHSELADIPSAVAPMPSELLVPSTGDPQGPLYPLNDGTIEPPTDTPTDASTNTTTDATSDTEYIPSKDPLDDFQWKDAPSDLDLGDGTQEGVKQAVIERNTQDPQSLAVTLVNIPGLRGIQEEILASADMPATSDKETKVRQLAEIFTNDQSVFDSAARAYTDFMSDPGISISFTGK